MIGPESVVTIDALDGYRIVRRLGRTSVDARRAPSFWSALARSIGALLGVPPLELRSDPDRVREECLNALRVRADELGANCIIGVRFEAVESEDGAVLLNAVGEAVVVEPSPP
jgi:uncharacterized protein YbjQ (UPF0145 family)